MKAAPFLLLALAASASACDQYGHCYCYDSDGSKNNDATTAICNYFQGTSSERGCKNPPNGEFVAGWNNCLFRIFCKIEGATGPDSKCIDKSGS